MGNYNYARDRRIVEQAETFRELPEVTQKKLEKEFPRKEIGQRTSLYSNTMPQVIKEVKEFAKKWKKTIDDVSIEHYSYDDYGGTSSALDMTVTGLETDEQYHGRLWETHDATCKREEWERREFERLSAKFK